MKLQRTQQREGCSRRGSLLLPGVAALATTQPFFLQSIIPIVVESQRRAVVGGATVIARMELK